MKVCVLSVASVGLLFSFKEVHFATDLSSYYDGKIQQQRKYTEVVQRVMQMDLMQSLQLCMKE